MRSRYSEDIASDHEILLDSSASGGGFAAWVSGRHILVCHSPWLRIRWTLAITTCLGYCRSVETPLFDICMRAFEGIPLQARLVV